MSLTPTEGLAFSEEDVLDEVKRIARLWRGLIGTNDMLLGVRVLVVLLLMDNGRTLNESERIVDDTIESTKL